MTMGGFENSWPLTAYGSSVAWFRNELAHRRIVLDESSPLGIALHRLEAYAANVLVDDTFFYPSTEAAFEEHATIYGADLLTKAIHVGCNAGLSLTRDRWNMLATDDPLVTRPVEKSEDQSGRNKTWETVIGCLTANFAADVRFEEPDVTCIYQGQRHVIAAKMIYSTRKITKNVLKGAEQAAPFADVQHVFANPVALLKGAEILRLSRTVELNADQMALHFEVWSRAWVDAYGCADACMDIYESGANVAFFMPLLIDSRDAPRPLIALTGFFHEGKNGGFEFARQFQYEWARLPGFTSTASTTYLRRSAPSGGSMSTQRQS